MAANAASMYSRELRLGRRNHRLLMTTHDTMDRDRAEYGGYRMRGSTMVDLVSTALAWDMVRKPCTPWYLQTRRDGVRKSNKQPRNTRNTRSTRTSRCR